MLEAAAEEEEEWIEERRIRAKSWRVCGGGGEEGQRLTPWAKPYGSGKLRRRGTGPADW